MVRICWPWIDSAIANCDNTGYVDVVHGKFVLILAIITAERLVDIILRFNSDLDQFGRFTRPTLAAFGSMTDFDNSPLYTVMHELCYLRG